MEIGRHVALITPQVTYLISCNVSVFVSLKLCNFLKIVGSLNLRKNHNSISIMFFFLLQYNKQKFLSSLADYKKTKNKLAFY